MRKDSEKIIAGHIKPWMKILDVGGGGGTCRFASHVIDQMSYEKWINEWRPEGVTISKENWIIRDICDHRAWPFPDKFFDFIICSHTLEDIRDPVWVCKEMSRVGKARYVETPSPLLELTRGMNPGRRGKRWIGFYHHRWLIWVEEDVLMVRYKPHFLHSSRRFHFPPRYAKKWSREGKAYTSFFWRDHCPAREVIFRLQHETENDIEDIIIKGEGRQNFTIRMHRAYRFIWDCGKLWLKKMGLYSWMRSHIEKRGL